MHFSGLLFSKTIKYYRPQTLKASEKAAEKSSKLAAEAASKLGSLSLGGGAAEAKSPTPRVADAKEASPRAGAASKVKLAPV